MANYPKPEHRLSVEDVKLLPDQHLPGGVAPVKSWSENTGTSNSGQGSDDAIGDMIATRLTSLIEDCIQQVTSSKELLRPAISEIKGSSDEISNRLKQSRKQALLRKDELEAERQAVHQAACKVVNVLNDTMEGLYNY
ncbi:hypothetical protein M758_1G063000 [Ceratodon purpureus]|nr:hypothetical protein M758_1G063000 [Ceratodon purpureus]